MKRNITVKYTNDNGITKTRKFSNIHRAARLMETLEVAYHIESDIYYDGKKLTNDEMIEMRMSN